MRGVPLIIQTNNFEIYFTGAKRDIEPNAIISPNGNEPISVTKKSLSVCMKPMLRELMTVGICFIINSIILSHFLLFFCLIQKIEGGYSALYFVKMRC